MKHNSQQEISIPVLGMTCGGCAANVERALTAVPGVSHAAVDHNHARASVSYDPYRVDLLSLQQAVAAAGYEVPTTRVELELKGMSCLSCVSRVQSALEDLPGVITASVTLSIGRAVVDYLAGVVSPAQMLAAVSEAGYPGSVAEGGLPPGQVTPPDGIPGQEGRAHVWRFQNKLRRR